LGGFNDFALNKLAQLYQIEEVLRDLLLKENGCATYYMNTMFIININIIGFQEDKTLYPCQKFKYCLLNVNNNKLK